MQVYHNFACQSDYPGYQGLLGALVDLLQGMMPSKEASLLYHPHRISCCLAVVYDHN